MPIQGAYETSVAVPVNVIDSLPIATRRTARCLLSPAPLIILYTVGNCAFKIQEMAREFCKW